MRVSVGIPTVNRAACLREAITSVAAQTYRDVEVVIADNSANDSYHREVDSILGEFPELTFRLVRHPRHLDSVDNLNSLIDAARSEGWVLLPDDDLLAPTFLSRAVLALGEHPNCGFTFGDHWIIDKNGNIDVAATDANTRKYRRNRLREGVYPHDALFPLALDQAICLQTMLFRHEVIAAHRFAGGVVCADLSLTLRLASGSDGFDAYYLDERVFKYRIHGDQITSSLRRRDMLTSAIAAFEGCGVVPANCIVRYRARLADYYLSLALIEAETHDRPSAATHARRSLRLAPSPRRALDAALAVFFPWAITPVRQVLRKVRPWTVRR